MELFNVYAPLTQDPKYASLLLKIQTDEDSFFALQLCKGSYKYNVLPTMLYKLSELRLGYTYNYNVYPLKWQKTSKNTVPNENSRRQSFGWAPPTCALVQELTSSDISVYYLNTVYFLNCLCSQRLLIQHRPSGVNSNALVFI